MDLKLEEKCDHPLNGYQRDFYNTIEEWWQDCIEKCDHCNDKGMLLTELGEKVLTFVRDWLRLGF